MITDFFIAKENDAPNYNGGGQYREKDKISYNCISALEVAGIFVAITGEEDRIAYLNQFSALPSDEWNKSIFPIPQELIDVLCDLKKDDMPMVAAKLAAITQIELRWKPSKFIPLLLALKQLSQRAKAENKQMYHYTLI